MKNKLSIHKLEDKLLLIQELTPQTEKKLLKTGDKVISIHSNIINSIVYDSGSFGYLNGDKTGFFYLQSYHWKIIKTLSQKDLLTLTT